jgi:hypothetical protein
MRSAVILSALALMAAPSPARATYVLPPPTLRELALVWVGCAPGDTLSYFRLELAPDGTGLLTAQFLPQSPVAAYAVTRTDLKERTISIQLRPLDAGRPALTLHGTADKSRLVLVLEEPGAPKQTIHLSPYAALMRRLRAVTERAQQHARPK